MQFVKNEHFWCLYATDLDPLTMLLQQEIDKGSGFNSDHIFYKVIFNAITLSSAKPGNLNGHKISLTL